jgi:steroid 5-alpha reductase family enzyme
MPVIYAWIVAAGTDFEPRIVLMAILASLWGARLTYNFNRRGGYSWKFWTGDEDYRWAILRAKPMFRKPWAWPLFNLFFISYYQMALILLFTLPIVKAHPGGPIGAWDIILSLCFIALLVIETVADQQQWNFQTEKYRRRNAGEDAGPVYGKGFVHTGLWAMVRHPNYAAEQGIWIVFYLFSIVAGGAWFNWSITGVILLLLLFKSSSDFSEAISAAKYPDYAAYRQTVGRFLPTPWRSGVPSTVQGDQTT